MSNNWGSVYPYFSVSTQQTRQKQPISATFSTASAKSAHSKAEACDKSKSVQSDPAKSDCDQQNSRKPRNKPRYLGTLRLTKSVVGSIVWWARCDGGNFPEGFMQVFEGNGYPQLRHPNSKEALENPHLLNTKTPDRIAAVFVNEAGQSDPVWIDLKREALIQCD
jgi:hypothetical protein